MTQIKLNPYPYFLTTGYKYIDDCPVESGIPLFLISLGTTSLLIEAVIILQMIFDKADCDGCSKYMTIAFWILCLSFLGCVIAGELLFFLSEPCMQKKVFLKECCNSHGRHKTCQNGKTEWIDNILQSHAKTISKGSLEETPLSFNFHICVSYQINN